MKKNVMRFHICIPSLEVYDKPGWQGKPTGEVTTGNQQVDVTNIAGADVWLEIGPGRWVQAKSGLETYVLKESEA